LNNSNSAILKPERQTVQHTLQGIGIKKNLSNSDLRINLQVWYWLHFKGRKTVYSRHKTASTNDGLPEISKMKYRNLIPEPVTTISGFADSKKKKLTPGVGLGDLLTPDIIPGNSNENYFICNNCSF
jgi:hypothetical protein